MAKERVITSKKLLCTTAQNLLGSKYIVTTIAEIINGIVIYPKRGKHKTGFPLFYITLDKNKFVAKPFIVNPVKIQHETLEGLIAKLKLLDML